MLLHLIYIVKTDATVTYTGAAGAMTINIYGGYCTIILIVCPTTSYDIILVRNAPCYVSCDISSSIDRTHGYTCPSPSPSRRLTNNPTDGPTNSPSAILASTRTELATNMPSDLQHCHQKCIN